MSVPLDPNMLLSYINTLLRDSEDSLSDLCASVDADEQAVRDKLATIGYYYDAQSRRFIGEE